MRKSIFESKYVELPSVLAESEKYGLRKGELTGLLNRMRFIDQLQFELSEWKSMGIDSDSISSFIDRVELHSALCLALPSDSEEYSWWLVHSGLEPYPVAHGQVSPAVLYFLGLDVPTLHIDKSQFGAWVLSAEEAIKEGLSGFFSAESMSPAWNNLVALNSLVALVLSGVSRQRIIR